MEIGNIFLNKLSLKIYLNSITLYITVTILMILPQLFIKFFSLSQFWASFITFFIVALLRIIYEKLIIYELPKKELSVDKVLVFVFVNTSVMTAVMFFIKPYIGYFSIPVAVAASGMFVTKLKEFLWPTSFLPEFFIALNKKLKINSHNTYLFYIFLVGITYLGYAKFNFNFYYCFALAYFVGTLVEEYYNFTKVYELKLNNKFISYLGIWALFCSILASLIVWIIMQKFGYSGQISTITAVVLVKLIQPLVFRKFLFLQ